jgi:PKD repeat protein
MRKVGIIFLSVFFFLFLPLKVSAHNEKEIPYFKINGEYSTFYPIPSISVDTLEIPHDLAPQSYVVNQDIVFEVDTTQLQVPPEILQQSKLIVNFGDGTKGEGIKTTHRYMKPGSYMLRLSLTDPRVGEFETVFLDVLPRTDYHLPQAVIMVNGELGDKLASDPLRIKPGDVITFDASASTASSSAIKKVTWDFGDGTTSDQKVVTHIYDEKSYLLFPMLRVEDQNGFISDTYTVISNDAKNGDVASTSASVANSSQKFSIRIFLFGLLFLICGGVLIGVFIFFAHRNALRKGL